MEKKLNIFVIIVTYNGMQWIGKCLQSLKQSTYPITTIIVDNNSTDDTRDFVINNYKDVVWMPQTNNLGFGQANNIGMRYALEHDADYILLLNQDAYLQPTAIEEMLKVADGYNLVSPIHLNGNGTRLDAIFRESLKRADNEILDDLLVNGSVKSSYDVGEICAACWFMPISMLKEIGGFNPLFFHYGEDRNYYTRIIYNGRKLTLAPKAMMYHDRTLHGNVQLYNKKRIHHQILIVACNPNYNILQCIRQWIKIMVNAPTKFTIEFCKLIPSFFRIMKSRSIEGKKQACWL